MKPKSIKIFAGLAQIVLLLLITGCSRFGFTSSSAKATPIVPTLTPDISLIGKTSDCSGYLALIKAFYDANDAGHVDVSLSLLKPDVTVATWGEGVNGRHWTERHLIGRDSIKAILSQRGFRRRFEQPDAPKYNETEFTIVGNQISFYLRPDRLGADGRPHDPYEVVAVIYGCKIQSLKVVERFTAP